MSQKAIKTKRSNSARLMGMIENKLKIPGGATTKLDRSNSVGNHREFVEDCSEDCDTPDILPILRRTTLSSSGVTKDPRLVSTEGLMKYEEMLKTLKCGHCAQTTCPPLLQCRKGHLYCRSCKVDNKIIQCNTCKQTFVDAPNLALDNLVRLIAVPCKFGGRGCPAFVFLDTRLQHETLCKFRPVNCQYEKHGCTAIFAVKDMCWHHKMCPFANYPHPNVLPSMPTRKKGVKTPDLPSDTQGGSPAPQQQGGSPAPSSPILNGDLATPPSGDVEIGDLSENPSVEVQTEIKLFPGVLSNK